MNTEEARTLLKAELSLYRTQTYEELQRLLEEEDTFERTTPSGSWCQLEIRAVWDDRAGGNLRVIGSVDDGGWWALIPLCDSFIIAPSGAFVGE